MGYPYGGLPENMGPTNHLREVPDTERRYMANLPALSREEQQAISQKRLVIVGCGGLGGYLLEYALRLGFRHILVADGDVFEGTNLNRQLLATSRNLGCGKARAAVERGKTIDPDAEITAVGEFLTEENALTLIQNCDAVLDGLDNVPSRRILADACEKGKVPLIHGAICGWTAQAAISLPGDGLVEKLYGGAAAPSNGSVLSFTPALCAAMQVSLCTRLLTGRPVETEKIYVFDLLNMEFEEIPML